MSVSADYLRNYWKKYAIARRLLQDSDTEYSANGESAYYTSLKQSILGEVTQMRGFLWRSMGFIQDPSPLYETENFSRTELVRFMNDFSGFVPEWCGFGNGNARRSCYSFDISNPIKTPFTLLNDNYDAYPITSSPAIGSDGLVYVCNSGGYLFACRLDSTQGLIIIVSLSPYYLGAECHCSPAIGSDGTIYIGSDNGKLTSLKFNGLFFTKQWDYTSTGSPIRSSPVIGNDGTIYFGSDDTFLYAITPNGVLKWVGPVGAISESGGDGLISGKMRSSPAILSDGTIVVGTQSGTLYSVNGKTGNILSSIDVEGPIETSPVVGADGFVYVTTTNGIVSACKFTSYELSPVWSYTTSIGAVADAIDFTSVDRVTGVFTTTQTGASIKNGDRIQFNTSPTDIITHVQGYIQNYTLDNAGNQTFQVSDSYHGKDIMTNLTYMPSNVFLFLTNLTSPSIDLYGGVCVGSSNGNFYVFNKSKNPSVAIIPIGIGSEGFSSITSSPILCGTNMYVVCNDGGFYNIPSLNDSSNTGEFNVIVESSRSVPIRSSPAIGKDGTVYVGNDSGDLISIYSSIL